MREAVRRAVPIIATGIVAVGCLMVGVLIGAKKGPSTVIAATTSQRFISTGKPGFAFDTKLGQECDMDGVDVPQGVILDISRCADLAKR